MLEEHAAWTDERMGHILGPILQRGVLIAGLVVVLGGIMYLSRHGSEGQSEHRVFQGQAPSASEPSAYASFAGIMTSVRNGQGRGIIQLGLLLLVAIPIFRIAFSLVAFGLQRDLTYVAITAVILLVLLISLTGVQ